MSKDEIGAMVAFGIVGFGINVMSMHMKLIMVIL